jgi:hypothetical protein
MPAPFDAGLQHDVLNDVTIEHPLRRETRHGNLHPGTPTRSVPNPTAPDCDITWSTLEVGARP